MAVPVFDSSGALTLATNDSSIEVDYPATVNSGDMLILTFAERNSTIPGVPTGFTLVDSMTQSGQHSIAVWKRVADGTETGSVTISTAASSLQMGRMHRFTGADSSEDADTVGATSRDPAHPDTTTTGTDRLAVAVTFVNDDDAASSFTGETGGDFTLDIDDTTIVGQDGGLSMQTASMATSGTISGGTWGTPISGANEDKSSHTR